MQKIGFGFLDRPGVAEQLRLVRRIEALGYSSVWTAETRLVREAPSVLGAFAQVTQRITIGGIINSWTRGPALVALTLATLEEMAPGRLAVSVGPYWDPLACKQGIHREQIGTQMREFITVVRALLALDSVTFHGQQVTVQDLTLDLGHGLPRRPLQVPIYILGVDQEMIEIGAEIADGVLLNALLSTAYTRGAREWIAAAAQRAGRRPSAVDCPQLVFVAMSKNPSEAQNAARRMVTMYLAQKPHFGKANALDPDFLRRLNEAIGSWPPRPGGVESAMSFVDDSIVDQLAVAGAPDHCRQRIQDWVEAGAAYPIVVPITDNCEEICEALAPA